MATPRCDVTCSPIFYDHLTCVYMFCWESVTGTMSMSLGLDVPTVWYFRGSVFPWFDVPEVCIPPQRQHWTPGKQNLENWSGISGNIVPSGTMNLVLIGYHFDNTKQRTQKHGTLGRMNDGDIGQTPPIAGVLFIRVWDASVLYDHFSLLAGDSLLLIVGSWSMIQFDWAVARNPGLSLTREEYVFSIGCSICILKLNAPYNILHLSECACQCWPLICRLW